MPEDTNRFVKDAPSFFNDLNIAEERGSILLVDDDKLVLAALEMTLKQEGYHVMTKESGEEAIEVLKKEPVALLICDQTMSGIDGIEVMKIAQELKPDTVRILLTGHQDMASAIDAINIGHVSQYLTKPWEDSLLKKTVKSALEKYKLVKENKILQSLIFNQHKKLQKAHKSLKQELMLGARIHQHMLLGNIPKDVPGFEIQALSCPSREIDGDFFEFYRPEPHILDMVLGDVMGKGIAAALVGTAVKTQMIRFAMPYPFFQIFDKKTGWNSNQLSPDEIISHVHKEIAKKLIDLEYFVSLFYGRFNLQYKIFTYLDCGSAKPIHFRAATHQASLLSGSNFPLGVVENPTFSSAETMFEEGDIFVFYSDGVSEARSPSQEFFGTERIVDIVQKNCRLEAEAIGDLIRKSVIAFAKKEKFDDDLTLVVIKIGFYERPKVAKYAKASFCSKLSQLQAVRDFVRRFCKKAPGDSERLSNEMQLVADEAFCNIVKHGHLENAKETIEIDAELGERGVFLHITDQGLPFNPETVHEPCFSGHRETGYGWHIIKQLCDTISYSRKEEIKGWNKLTLFKRYCLGGKKMEITHKIEEKVLVITPEKESLDAKDSAEFKEKIIDLINEKSLSAVVFDLSKLTFIDSSGFGSFLSILRLLNSRGGDLKLSRMSEQIKTLFELVKMDRIFEIFHSTKEAVASFDL